MVRLRVKANTWEALSARHQVFQHSSWLFVDSWGIGNQEENANSLLAR